MRGTCDRCGGERNEKNGPVDEWGREICGDCKKIREYKIPAWSTIEEAQLRVRIPTYHKQVKKEYCTVYLPPCYKGLKVRVVPA